MSESQSKNDVPKLTDAVVASEPPPAQAADDAEPVKDQDESAASRRGISSSNHSGNSNSKASGSSTNKRRVSMSKGTSMRRRSSGLFQAARQSFYRSRGQSGASVETLRGNTGADFEGYATVHRGEADGVLDMFDLTNLLCFCNKKKDGLYFLLIKGYHCFVFKDEESKSPKYAIELMNMKAVIQPSHESFIPHVPHPGAGHDTTYTTIHLETSLGDVDYKFTFANKDSENLATKFCNAVAVASNEASTEQVRKRLGHENLLSKRSSVRYANTIGKEKAKEQPEAPVGAGEVLAGMPTVAY